MGLGQYNSLGEYCGLSTALRCFFYCNILRVHNCDAFSFDSVCLVHCGD